jgi:hypothetical protein
LTLNYGNVSKTGEVAGFFSAWRTDNILVIILIIPLAMQYLIEEHEINIFIKYYREYVFPRQTSFLTSCLIQKPERSMKYLANGTTRYTSSETEELKNEMNT